MPTKVPAVKNAHYVGIMLVPHLGRGPTGPNLHCEHRKMIAALPNGRLIPANGGTFQRILGEV